ncbi:alpha/beta hydrolase [Umezawaea endophytica]|uniref:Alpha/beta hydrolase n=1 Tax=Umezawaea endophytica TaxID=1654476 RepID=A0A9X2VFY5_9PSEU|nr:alpha/beta hydrolase [Umezawaea endophytica]MCS7475729.1 alpha/beta hydrolase [Umezawaea endophytica]
MALTKPGPRVVALAITGGVLLSLVYLTARPDPTLAVPDGAGAGSLALEQCDFDTEAGPVAADCGTLVVSESRRDPSSDLIALPVVRVRASSPNPGAPVFRLAGGPGGTNMAFPQASRLNADHDVVLVGYRGIDGSRRLDCPEFEGAMHASDELAGAKDLPATTRAFELCATRLTREGVDLTGYSVVQRVEDLEAARTALGYSKINLLSSSAGTRTAMVYSWRHPEALHRSAMVSVNPPGHFVWDPRITDSQFAQYAELCRADADCAARTPDLAASIRDVATTIPERWGPFRVKDTNVRILSQYGMHHNGAGSAPNNAPTLVDAYLSGDTGALWAMSVLGDVMLPSSIVWGEFASFAMIDAPAARRYYEGGGDPGSVLGNASSDFLWTGKSGFSTVWPDSPDNAEYRELRPSDVETLLVSGSVDFSTPSQLATDELLPTLSRGKQVVLPGLGHTSDFWEHRPEASEHLLTTFYDTGEVDDSRFDARPVGFGDVPMSMSTIAKLLVGITVTVTVLALLLLGAMARRRHVRGGFSPRAGVWLRVLTVVPLGLGGWFLDVLLVWTVNPDDFIASTTVIAPGVSLMIGVGAYLAWAPRDLPRRARRTFLAAVIGAAFVGAVLGSGAADGLVAPFTAIVGAAAAANLALVALGSSSRFHSGRIAGGPPLAAPVTVG